MIEIQIRAKLRTPGNRFFPDNSVDGADYLTTLDRICHGTEPPFFDQEPRVVDGF